MSGKAAAVSGMGQWELIGYGAAILVLVAFYMRDVVPLRLAAMCSNLAFIAYGLALGLAPVWLLHALLLPMNGCRLLQELRARRHLGYKPTRDPQLLRKRCRSTEDVMQNAFGIVDVFAITGRRVAAVIEGSSSVPFGAVLTVAVRVPNGGLTSYLASKEAMRLAGGQEVEAWLLGGASVDQVPRGSTLLLPETHGG